MLEERSSCDYRVLQSGMNGGGATDLPLCPECDERHDPGDHERCELNLLRQRAAGEDVEPDVDPYEEGVSA